MIRRRLGDTPVEVSGVALGCWPVAGMTSLDVNEADSLRTIRAALDAGVNFYDTAFCYGPDGESEKLIARVMRGERDRVVLATKAGIHWGPDGERVFDARPQRLRRECELSLGRLDTDCVDLLYLHAPDPAIPIEESAGELARLMDEGKTRYVGASNLSLPQLKRFQAVCNVTAVQPAYNMLMRQAENDLIPWCFEHNVSVIPYWPLMKGLLAGALSRDHVFRPGDGRTKYPMFQGEEWLRNHDLMDELKLIARDAGKTVAQLVVHWTVHQHGITSVLCGAKRAYQIQETAGASGWTLNPSQQERIEQALERRGVPVTVSAV